VLWILKINKERTPRAPLKEPEVNKKRAPAKGLFSRFVCKCYLA
jgi:hypothetical protein